MFSQAFLLCCVLFSATINLKCLAKDPEELKYCYLHSLLGRPKGTCGNRLDETVEDICEARARGLPHELIYDLYSKRSQPTIPAKTKTKTKHRSWEIPKKSALDFLRPSFPKRQGKIAEYEDGDLQISLWDAGNQTLTMMDFNQDAHYGYNSPTLERGIYCECCVHHCSIGEILEYCH